MLSERKPEKYSRERCRIVLLPYLEAAVERYERDRTVAGKYELRFGSTKVKDMIWPPEIKTRRLIADSNYTITFTNAEGQRRDLLAVVVAKERNGDAYNPLLAYQPAGQRGMLIMKTGIVHLNRSDRGESNRVVCGIATDGYHLQILMIDNKSNLFQPCVYTTDEGWGFFLKYLDTILAEARWQCEE